MSGHHPWPPGTDRFGQIPPLLWHALDRDRDHSGISGTGRIAYTLSLPSSILMLWNTGWPTLELLPSLNTVHEIHGYGGDTRIVPMSSPDAGQQARAAWLADRRRATELLREAHPALLGTVLDLDMWTVAP